MKVTLQYFDGCPNWNTTDAHLQRILIEGQIETKIDYQLIDTIVRAEETGFRGSPTVLIDGIDPFAERDAPVGLACRIYQTDNGPSGSPTLRQLQQAIASASEKEGEERW